jgi:DNA polymerase I-like protein with 3'-5' exonuclease and polymerase domains
MSKLIFDLETDGLLADVTKIHCMVTKEVDTGEIRRYTRESMDEGIQSLREAEQIIGHNIVGYDIPVLRKLYDFSFPIDKVFDTLVVSRLLNTELKRFDFKRTKHNFPTNLLGSHSLEAWGHRLGEYKGYKPESWEVYTPEMLEYCEQDVKVTEVLYQKFLGRMWEGECILLEHQVAEVIQLQEMAGVYFDTQKAGELLSTLHEERWIVEKKLKEKFQGWFKFEEEFTPKRPNKSRGYTKGGTMSKIKWIEFNPGSRQHLVHVLKDKYGWKPKKISDAGNALMDESVLKGLSKLAGTADMLQYLTISKRISQLSEGRSAWLKYVTKEGTIHGRVNPMGTITGRMSHYSPNMSQVPAVYSPYGKECRELFTVRSSNNFIVGADADGLELRCLAHYLYKYDGGKYARAVLYGNKEEGTDAHSLTLKALGSLCDSRDTAKTFFYALLYGAGDYKLGLILGETGPRKATAKGKSARARVEKGITGLGKLNAKITRTIDQRQKKHKRQWLNGLDGRKIFVRSEHAALNSLLQSAGGVIMKRALIELHQRLTAPDLQWEYGRDWWYLINSHDEWQIEIPHTTDSLTHATGRWMCDAMTRAGKHFNFKVPITGEYKVGTLKYPLLGNTR